MENNSDFYNLCQDLMDQASEEGVTPKDYRSYLEMKLEDMGVSEKELLDRSKNIDEIVTERLIKLAKTKTSDET